MWVPWADKKNIPPGENDPKFVPIGIIWHVSAGNSFSLYPYFNGPSGGIESHFYIRKNGETEQYRDTLVSVDAQAGGNWWVGADGAKYGYIAVETQGVCGEEWTDAQLDSMVRLSKEINRYHGVPYIKCNGPKKPGHGYHSQFAEWNPHNHACPCKERIAQIPTLLSRLNYSAPAIITGETDMKTFILRPLADTDTNDLKSAYLWTPGGTRRLLNETDVKLARAAGAVDLSLPEAEIRSLIPQEG